MYTINSLFPFADIHYGDVHSYKFRETYLLVCFFFSFQRSRFERRIFKITSSILNKNRVRIVEIESFLGPTRSLIRFMKRYRNDSCVSMTTSVGIYEQSIGKYSWHLNFFSLFFFFFK